MKRYSFISKSSIAFLLIICHCEIAFAQDTPDANKEDNCIASSTEKCISKSELLGNLDLVTPGNPLFALSGSTPDSIIKPKTGEELALSLLPQAVDVFGNNQFAIAVEVNPGLLMMPDNILPQSLGFSESDKQVARDLGEKDLALARWLSNLSLTAAINRTTGDEDSTFYGLGASYVYDTKSPLVNNKSYRNCITPFFDTANSDLRLKRQRKAREIFAGVALNAVPVNPAASEGENKADIEKRVILEFELMSLKADDPNQMRREVVKLLTDAGVTDPQRLNDLLLEVVRAKSTYSDDFPKDLTAAIKSCRDPLIKWNRNVYGFGAAVYHKDVEKTNSDDMMMNTDSADISQSTGFGLWSSASFPVKSNGQIIGHVNYTDDLVRQRKVDEEMITENVDSLSFGARYTHQVSGTDKSSSKRKIRLFAEGGYNDEEFSNISDKYWQAGIGAELEIQKDLFFQFVIGDTFGSEIDRSNYLSGQFKWSFSNNPSE